MNEIVPNFDEILLRGIGSILADLGRTSANPICHYWAQPEEASLSNPDQSIQKQSGL